VPGKLGTNEEVNRIDDATALPCGKAWQSGAADGDEGPVFLILCALGDPAVEEIPLRPGELLRRGRRWHDVARIVGDQALPEFAGLRVARNDGGLDRISSHVEAEVRLPLVGVRPMAGVALGGENGPDVAAELDGRGRATSNLRREGEAEEAQGRMKEAGHDGRKERPQEGLFCAKAGRLQELFQAAIWRSCRRQWRPGTLLNS